MDPLPEQSAQQICTLAELLFLLGDADPALTAVQPIESGYAVNEEERQAGPRRQGGLQEVEGEEKLGGGGTVDHQEARET